MSAPDGTPSAKPLWRRIVDFPLVTMVLAIVAIGAVLVGATLLVMELPVEKLDQQSAIILNGTVVPLLVLLTYKLAIRHMGEAPRDDLPFDRRLADLPRGAVGAAILMSVIVGVVALMGSYSIVGWGKGTSWAEMLFFGGIQAAFVEEVVMRGILFRFLEEFGGSWFALALSSLVFGFAHAANDNATLFSSIAIALEAGLMLGGAYMLTRNLWLAIGIHFGWNVTQGMVWDVNVSGFDVDGIVESRVSGTELISGGAFGLEASVVALVLASAAGVWLVKRAVERGHVVRPWWVRRRLASAQATGAAGAAGV